MSISGSVLPVAREVRLTHAGAEPIGRSSFVVTERHLEALAPGELLVEVRYASLDPYQRLRTRMSSAGTVPPAGIVGQVVASASNFISVGEWVTAEATWTSHAVVADVIATVFEPDDLVPLHHRVGLLGLSGLTAYFGVTKVAKPSPGDKVVVTGAFGGVGQVASQIAMNMGADVLGLVGTPEKEGALRRLGVPVLNHRAPGWLDALDAWAPEGVDVLFDNVWGGTAARVVERLRPLGRVALCGQISSYGESAIPALPIDDWFRLVTRSLTVQGFRAADYSSEFRSARQELVTMLKAGTLKQEVHVVRGWSAAGQALVDLLDGKTVGKVVVDATVVP